MIHIVDITKFLPIKLDIAGKKRDYLLFLFDKIFPLRKDKLYKLYNSQITIDPKKY